MRSMMRAVTSAAAALFFLSVVVGPSSAFLQPFVENVPTARRLLTGSISHSSSLSMALGSGDYLSSLSPPATGGQQPGLQTAPATTTTTSRRKPIVGGNWKCNPASTSSLPELVDNFSGCTAFLDRCDVYVCPSNLHVALVKDSFAGMGISVAPQNCNFGGCGAYTGEMAVDQMVDMGLNAVLIGHSERRGEFGLPTPAESNELLATKLQYILDHGLNCIFCIGEPLAVRERGIDAVLAECTSQLAGIVPILRSLEDKSRVVIAYEPVWAIGTGVTASPQQAQETHKAIREWIAQAVDRRTAEGVRIQYGGSANAANAPELAACPDIDGFLVGGASLKPEIVDIVAATAK